MEHTNIFKIRLLRGKMDTLEFILFCIDKGKPSCSAEETS